MAIVFAGSVLGTPSAGEKHAVATFVRYGTRTAALGFARFGTHVVSFAPFLRGCRVARESDGTTDISCTSADHAISVERLGRFLIAVVPAELPRSLNRFACDSDSIGGYYLTWERSYAYPLYVSAYVSFHGERSYYILTVSMRSRAAIVSSATLPPEDLLNNCSWTH